MTVPMSVMGLVMISSPGSRFSAATAVCSAAVPDVTACAYGTPSISAQARSSAATFEPSLRFSAPLSITSASSCFSSSPSDRPDALA